MTTQLQEARDGHISRQVEFVARAEDISAEQIRCETAAGRLVIPANKIHIANGLEPVGIGRLLTTKVNANIGTSPVNFSVDAEIEKMNTAIEAGADVIMDLSTGGDIDDIRQTLLGHCKVPFGTVPIYQVIEQRDIEDIDEKIIIECIIRQAEQGVDFFTIHAGLLKEHLSLVRTRIAGIVSRGGALLAKWMLYHNRQNPLYEMFDELCDIMVEYDICFSLGDGLRPGAIADATDDAQIAELRTLGELTQRAQEKGCQVMVEGPGHVPFDQIEKNMRLQQEICNGAPFYVLGPLVTDIAPGYDHITSAIGGTAAAFYGACFLCYVTPTEHLGLPGVDDVRMGVIASKIAAHAADVARGLKGAADRDRQLSIARANIDWKNHIGLSLDPKTAEKIHRGNDGGDVETDKIDYCSMCGEKWCSLRTSKDVKKAIEEQKTAKP